MDGAGSANDVGDGDTAVSHCAAVRLVGIRPRLDFEVREDPGRRFEVVGLPDGVLR